MPLQGRLDKDHGTTLVRDTPSRNNVSSLDLTESRVAAERMDVLMLLQHVGPTVLRQKSRDRRDRSSILRSPLKVHRIVDPALDVDTTTQYDFRYSGAAP